MDRPLCEKCGDKPKEIAKKNKDGSILYRPWCWKCRSAENPNYDSHHKKHRNKMRTTVLTHYGGKCECCGEDEPLFLTVDHINGGGKKHRQEIGGGGFYLHRWLIKNNFPEGFRILCFNCNCGRSLNKGVCPHHGPIEQ